MPEMTEMTLSALRHEIASEAIDWMHGWDDDPIHFDSVVYGDAAKTGTVRLSGLVRDDGDERQIEVVVRIERITIDGGEVR